MLWERVVPLVPLGDPVLSTGESIDEAHVEATQTASGGDEENEDVEGRCENRHYRNSMENGFSEVPSVSAQ